MDWWWRRLGVLKVGLFKFGIMKEQKKQIEIKNHLFGLIRKEEVVIWAGAGLSLYAGYPSAKQLVEILFNTLSISEKKLIRKSLALPDFAEQVYRLKGENNSIPETLKKVFLDFIPISVETHEKIASIPHFKTIITTNYDRLFEIAYDTNAQVAFKNEHIPYLRNDTTHLLKIHGDLSSPETIIIKNSDYEVFSEKGTEYNVFWTSVKEVIASKSILFLGYNLEDSNTRVLFNRISKALGEHRKPCFMISPNLPRLKISDLNNSNIFLINSKGEDFINELKINIEENIIQDHEDGIVSTDTFKKFLFYNKVSFELNFSNTSTRLKSIKGEDDSVESKLNFTIESNIEYINNFQDFASGKKVGKFKIDKSILKKVDFRIGRIKLPLDDTVIILKSSPIKTSIVDFRFENGFEFEGKTVEIFGKFPYFEAQFKLKGTQLNVKTDFTETKSVGIKLDYLHNPKCTNIKDEIEEFTFINHLFWGVTFKLFWGDGNKHLVQSAPFQQSMIDYSEFYLEYFNNLKLIESHYNLKFDEIEFDTIDQESFDLVYQLSIIIKNDELKYTWDDVVEATLFDNAIDAIKDLEKLQSEKILFEIIGSVEEVVEIHKHKIILGYKNIKIEDPYVVNLDEIKLGSELIVKVKSKTKKIIVTYTKNQKEQQNRNTLN